MLTKNTIFAGMKLLMVLFFFALGVWLPAWADTEFILTQYTTADGICNNTVRKIVQDEKGYLWIATSNGLSCFDGKEFVNFRPTTGKAKPGLDDRRISDLVIVDNLLWIYSNAGGVSCLDLRDRRFIDIRSKKRPSTETGHQSDSRQIKDSKGRTWRVTENDGLYITDSRTGESEHYTTSSPHNALPTNALKCIMMDRDGIIWVGTDNLGLSRIEPIDNDGVRFIHKGENIRMVMSLDSGLLAVGNRNGDVWIYDNRLEKQPVQHRLNANTYCIYKDKHGRIWQGTKGLGLRIDGDSVNEQPYHDIYSILQDKEGRIWIGTFGAGLYLYDARSRFLDCDYGSKRIRAMMEDNYSNIWAATSNGIYIFKPSRLIRQRDCYTHLDMESGHLKSNEIRTLFKDSRGNIYIAETGEGFAVVPYDRTSRSLQPEDFIHFTQADSLVNSMVQSFVEDKDGFVWIATELGMSRFNPSTRSMTNYYFSNNMLDNVYSENCGTLLGDGRIAFGTNNGLMLLNPDSYNTGARTTDIGIDDITVNGRPLKRGIIYVVSKWWKSPWAFIAYAVICMTILLCWRKVRRSNRHFHQTIQELNDKESRLNAEKQELVAEKEVLIAEKENIEERLSTQVRIKRKEDLSARDDEFVRKVEEIAMAQLSNSDFSADDFARQMGLGRTIFFNRMKSITGYSPKEYMKMLRLKHGAELIATSSCTIAEIAVQVGIDDALYFSRIFKSRYGCSPTEWRAKANRQTKIQ